MEVAHEQRARIRNELLWELKTNEYDCDVMPHYGLVPDWFPRYKRLAQLIEEYLYSEHTELDKELWQEQKDQRNVQRETKGAETDITGC